MHKIRSLFHLTKQSAPQHITAMPDDKVVYIAFRIEAEYVCTVWVFLFTSSGVRMVANFSSSHRAVCDHDELSPASMLF